MSRARTIEFTVGRDSASGAGQRLDILIAQGGHGLTRSQVKTLVEQGQVTVDGDIVPKAGLLLEPGARVTVVVPEPRKLDLTPHDVAIQIIHEDDALAVLEKPAGLSVHPSTTEAGPTVVHGLLSKLKTLSSVGGVERPGIVHRIDKGTSGILVVSKTDAAHAGLSRQFKDHSIDRRYKALVYGELRDDSGRIDTLYGRHPVHRKKMTGRLETSDAKPVTRRAITHWSVLERLHALTLVECRLETGRTHQIRVHLGESGHPVVGDQLYCDNVRQAKVLAKRAPALARLCAELTHQLLHAYRLGFTHPITGQKLLFESPLPADFTETLRLAREASS